MLVVAPAAAQKSALESDDGIIMVMVMMIVMMVLEIGRSHSQDIDIVIDDEVMLRGRRI